jgi:hypothetical protein
VSPERAFSLGVRAKDCAGASDPRVLGGAWRVVHPDNDAVFIASAANPWAVGRWIGRLKRLESE